LLVIWLGQHLEDDLNTKGMFFKLQTDRVESQNIVQFAPAVSADVLDVSEDLTKPGPVFLPYCPNYYPMPGAVYNEVVRLIGSSARGCQDCTAVW
jgi:hypothetical protein